mgnify:CR=1 FL=1
MEKMVKKAVKTGFGLGILTLEQAKKVVSKIQRDMNLNKKESVNLARELVARSQEASDSVMRVASKQLDQAILKSGLIKKRELYKAKKVLKKRVKKKVSEARKKIKKPARSKASELKKKIRKIKRKIVSK